jgi:hypothetical protein
MDEQQQYDVIEIKLDKTTGLYGRDIEGQPWATFQLMGNRMPYMCDICGASIYAGWERGKWSEEDMYICSSHVAIIDGPWSLRERGLQDGGESS